MPPSVESGQPGVNRAEFRILQDGKVPADFLKLTVQSGKEEFDRASLTAIRASTPFSQLPEKFSHPFIAVRITFYYNMPRKISDQRRTLGPDAETGEVGFSTNISDFRTLQELTKVRPGQVL